MSEEKKPLPKLIFPVAQALRKAGYIPLPRLWVKPEDMAGIHDIANQHKDEVNTIRADVHAKFGPEGVQPRPKKKPNPAKPQKTQKQDPKTDPNAAWEAFERMKAGAR